MTAAKRPRRVLSEVHETAIRAETSCPNKSELTAVTRRPAKGPWGFKVFPIKCCRLLGGRSVCLEHNKSQLLGPFRPQWRTRAIRAGAAMMECMRLIIGGRGRWGRERDRERQGLKIGRSEGSRTIWAAVKGPLLFVNG